MAKISKEVKIGIAFIIALFILYYGIGFLKGINIFKPANSYMVVFDDVKGLTKSAPVTLNGFQVGIVSGMELDKNNASRVVAHLSMNKGVQIIKGSKINLESSMLGGGFITLELNPYLTDAYNAGDTIVGLRKKGLSDAAEDLTPQIEQIVPKIDSIITAIHLLVANPVLNQSLENVNQITSDLAQSSKQLTILTTNLNKELPVITNNMKTMSKDITGITGQLNEIDLVSITNSVDSTVKNIEHLSGKLTDKDNSLGLLLNDRQMYDSINSAIGNASMLLKDVKEHPQRYISIKVF